MLAFHLSKVPLIGTEESTPNLTVLSTGVTSYTGTWARFAEGKAQNTTGHRTVIGNVRVLTLARSRLLQMRDQFPLALSHFESINALPPNSLCSSDRGSGSPCGGMNPFDHGSDVAVLENLCSAVSSLDGDVHHRTSQVVGPNHLVWKQQLKRGVASAQ